MTERSSSGPASGGLTLFDAARAKAVSFGRETLPRDRYVGLNGLRFHYLEWGDPSKPGIILLHGFAQTAHSWDFVGLSLCEDYHLIALDQRGHGDTDWAPDADYSPAAYLRDLAAFTTSLAVDRPVVAGLSMGGRNAIAYAAGHSELMGGLVIVDFAPEFQRAGSEHIRKFVQDTDELDSIDEFVSRVQAYNPRRSKRQIRGSIVHNIKQLPSGKWTWKYDRVLRQKDRSPKRDRDEIERMWEQVDAVRCPTLVVRGANSNVVSAEAADNLRRRLDGARLATVPDAGHLVPGDNPVGFIAELRDFMRARQ